MSTQISSLNEETTKCKECNKQYSNTRSAKNKWCKPCQINYLERNFANWTSGNEKIDGLVKERQLKINNSKDTIFEWIPYDQFHDVKKIDQVGFETVYSAIWRNGPLHYNKEKYTRLSEQMVALKLYTSQNITDEFLNKVKSNYNISIYGISQNPDTKNYMMVLQYVEGENYKIQCEKCGKGYTCVRNKWCSGCIKNYLENNFTKWTSGDERIDHFIRERQLQMKNSKEIVTEWIPYNQFNNIEEISKDNSEEIYSAIWKDGPLHYDSNKEGLVRIPDKKVILNRLYNSQDLSNGFLLNEAKMCSIKQRGRHKIATIQYTRIKYRKHRNENKFVKMLGISQNPDIKDYILVLQYEEGTNYKLHCLKCGETYTALEYAWCKPCLINDLRSKFTTWTSGDETLDKFIQKRQLMISKSNDTIFEWIPYNQLNDIKEISKTDFETVDLAVWNNGPLHYNSDKKELTRSSNEKVILKYLYSSQHITSEFLTEVNEYSWTKYIKIYGISQDPVAKYYIIVLQYVKHENYNVKCEKCGKKYTILKDAWCRPCFINHFKINFTRWTSGNEEIDEFIREKQLKSKNPKDIPLEWIPYNQFEHIRKINKKDSVTVYSAIWINGSLNYDLIKKELTRTSNKDVVLKCLNSSQNCANGFLTEIESYLLVKLKRFANVLKIYGISQNPDTKDYMMVFQYAPGKNYEVQCKKCGNKYTSVKNVWCKTCQIKYLKNNFAKWTSGNERIDNFIQKMQLKIDFPDDSILEWIPYSQFNSIKEQHKGDFETMHTAIWKNGPLYYDTDKEAFLRLQDKAVALKCLYNSQNNINEFINEIEAYLISYITEIENRKFFQGIKLLHERKISKKKNKCINMYGISQNPDTKDYIMVFQYAEDKYYINQCKICLGKYTNIENSWCKPCFVKYIKNNFTKWSSGNGKVDNFIQEMQLKINHPNDSIFEWIPYNQFNDIKEIGEGGFATVYFAKWQDGPLYYKNGQWTRASYRQVALKCLHNFQNNFSDEFQNEIKKYSIAKFENFGCNIIKIYGISQNPDTKNYVMVLEYARGGNFNNWLKQNYKKITWSTKMETLANIANGLKEIHQKQMVHCDFHPGNILFIQNNPYISDMGLCKEVDNIEDKSEVCGVMPYMAPEVLRGKPYSQAADIYSFGMIMHFTATGKQPFADCAHDHNLMYDICKGTRPKKLNGLEAPKCYIELMEKCWNSDPDHRPNIIEIYNLFNRLTVLSSNKYNRFHREERYRRENLSSIENDELIYSVIHPQSIYTSRIFKTTDSMDNLAIR